MERAADFCCGTLQNDRVFLQGIQLDAVLKNKFRVEQSRERLSAAQLRHADCAKRCGLHRIETGDRACWDIEAAALLCGLAKPLLLAEQGPDAFFEHYFGILGG